MQPLIQGDPHPLKGSIEELPPHSRLPRLDLAIDWESPQQEFVTSARAFFAGPKAPKDSEVPKGRPLRVDWVEGKPPAKAFLASCLSHGIAIWVLILPIWGFLPQTRPTLAPVQIEYDVYDPPDLPKISLPRAAMKPSPPPKKADDASKQPVARGEDVYHPRQTILSVPVKVTHPRQTLIQPDAPAAPPKIVTPLPNIVQWAANEQPKLRIPVVPTAVAPKIERRKVRDVAAPEVANNEKNSGPLNIAQSQVDIARPQIPLNPMSKPVARQRIHARESGRRSGNRGEPGRCQLAPLDCAFRHARAARAGGERPAGQSRRADFDGAGCEAGCSRWRGARRHGRERGQRLRCDGRGCISGREQRRGESFRNGGPGRQQRTAGGDQREWRKSALGGRRPCASASRADSAADGAHGAVGELSARACECRGAQPQPAAGSHLRRQGHPLDAH